MTAGTLTATQLTKAYLQRIALTNTEGPSINAVRALNPKALEEAREGSTPSAPPGHVRGPLHGIPVIVKDNLDVAGHADHRGLGRAREQRARPRTRPVVAKLRAAGAILLGKLNLSEFANFLTNGMPSGYSLARRAGAEPVQRRHHAVRLELSGSGAGGRRPAWPRSRSAPRPAARSSRPSAAQGIVGLRPTIGLVSRTGILPISATQDTAGPMTRTVADAAAELGAIAGKDPEDPATDAAPDDGPGLPRAA